MIYLNQGARDMKHLSLMLIPMVLSFILSFNHEGDYEKS